jgi:peptidoglycan/LPS O-acetylase OafA/YrhL
LSGFLISSQLFAQIKQGQNISFKQFFLKEVFRIIPAFLVTVGLYFCFPFFREKKLPPLWKFLTFTQNLGLNIKDFGAFSHCWSLCVEEHFYLFLNSFNCNSKSKAIFKAYWLLIGLLIVGFAVRILYSFNHLYLPKLNNENSWMYWYKYIYYPTYNR